MAYVAGLVWRRDLALTVAIAGAVGLGTRTLGTGWRIPLKALVLGVAVVALWSSVAIALGFLAAAETHQWRAAPTLAPAIGAQPEIHVSPCPSPDETLSERPDGSYVCLVPIPSDPGTGPLLASPASKQG